MSANKINNTNKNNENEYWCDHPCFWLLRENLYHIQQILFLNIASRVQLFTHTQISEH